MTNQTDEYDPYPTGIKEAELGELHLQYTDRLFAMIIGDEAVAEINAKLAEALNLPSPITVTNEEGTFDAATFITVTDWKLQLLRRAVQEVHMAYVRNPWPVKRHSSKEQGVHPMFLDETRKYLKACNFTLAEVRTRHANVDPASRQYGIAGRPAAFGVNAAFDDLDLSGFED